MFILGADIEKIAAGDPIRAIVEDMQTIAAPDQNQLAKFVRMLGKHVLRIAIRHRHGLRRAGKKIGFSENELA